MGSRDGNELYEIVKLWRAPFFVIFSVMRASGTGEASIIVTQHTDRKLQIDLKLSTCCSTNQTNYSLTNLIFLVEFKFYTMGCPRWPLLLFAAAATAMPDAPIEVVGVLAAGGTPAELYRFLRSAEAGRVRVDAAGAAFRSALGGIVLVEGPAAIPAVLENVGARFPWCHLRAVRGGGARARVPPFPGARLIPSRRRSARSRPRLRSGAVSDLRRPSLSSGRRPRGLRRARRRGVGARRRLPGPARGRVPFRRRRRGLRVGRRANLRRGRRVRGLLRRECECECGGGGRVSGEMRRGEARPRPPLSRPAADTEA